MKRKLASVVLFTVLFSASALYGQTFRVSSFFNENTMTIFKGDLDMLADVNDYGEVDINKATISAGARGIDPVAGRLPGFRGAFGTNLGKLHFGLFYEGMFWDGYSERIVSSNKRYDAGTDTGFIFDNCFEVLIGNEVIGGLAFCLDFLRAGINKDENENPPSTTVTAHSGDIGWGAVWGKNFGLGGGFLKPELGFYNAISLDRTKEEISGSDTVKSRSSPSTLLLILTAEYVFAKEGNHQTTLGFGDYPYIILSYKPNKDAKKIDGAFYNTLFFEFKQVYDLSGSLSAGYLAGFSFALNKPGKDMFAIGFLPRVSAGLAYKTSEKFTFNTGVRLGSLRPEPSANGANNFGIYYNKIKDNSNPGVTADIKTTTFLPFVGAWGIGLLWQPEKIFTADFGVECALNQSTAANLNFNVLFTLNL